MPYLQYFCYSSPWMALAAAAAAVANSTLAILADADYQANYMTVAVRQANVLVANWAGDLQVDDSAAGRTLFNMATCVQAFQGSGSLPYPFNPPRLFARNSSLVITVVNNVATATDVQVVFHGNKVFASEEEMRMGAVASQ